LAIEAITDPHTWDAAAAQVVVDAVREFWVAYPSGLPNDITLTVSPTVDVYDIVSGELVGSYSAPVAPASVSGTNAGSYSMAAGAKIALKTATIRNGRRVRGGIFIVPTAGDVMDSNGTVSVTPRAAWVTALNTAMDTFEAANKQLVVWSRPREATEEAPARTGATAPVTSVEALVKGAVLRGRRD
jgi:hypothetical protein